MVEELAEEVEEEVEREKEVEERRVTKVVGEASPFQTGDREIPVSCRLPHILKLLAFVFLLSLEWKQCHQRRVPLRSISSLASEVLKKGCQSSYPLPQ